MKNPLLEVEQTLIDQLEKLNDDSVASTPEEAKLVVERSKVMSDIASNLVDINRLKLEAVKTAYNCNGVYDKYLGIEDR